MTVQELIEYLSRYSNDATVILASDAEGNGFSPLSEASLEYYVANTTYSGELDEYGDDGDLSVVLWPVN